MTEQALEKAKKVLDAMEGMTYLEWTKISFLIDQHFKKRASKMNNGIQIGSPEEVLEDHKWL